jgi:pimeloyl-ACP methyl ester carboxylesterase
MLEHEIVHARGEGGVRLSGRSFAGPRHAAGALLLHHGLASSQHIWDLMLPALVRRWHLATFDARGHGDSGKPASGYDFDTVIGDALAFARAAKLQRPIVVGHSWGAMVALELAARRSRSIGGAVLVDGGLTGPRDSFPDWTAAKRALAPPVLAGMPVEEFRGLIRMFFDESVEVTPDVEEIVLSVMRIGRDGRIRPHLSRAHHFRILRAIWDLDPAPLYARLRVPTLAIAARTPDDGGWTDAKVRSMARARSAAKDAGAPVRFAWMDGIHDLPLQQPAALARRVDRFARGVVG